MTTLQNNKTIKANFWKAKILVIEDNADQWLLIENAMQHCLSEVTPIRVANYREALTALNEWSSEEWEMPKLILMDLYLPNREESWNLLQLLKELPAPSNQIPVVVLSYSNAPADINEAYRHGCSSYMVKPTDDEGWIRHFQQLRSYWWETVTLPPLHMAI